MADQVVAEHHWWARARAWLLTALIFYSTGVWGYLDLKQPEGAQRETLSWPEALYRGLRLFTLNVDLPGKMQAPLQLWIAAFVAPGLFATGVVALLWSRFSGVLVERFARPRLVVFGANARAVTLVEDATKEVRTGRWWQRWWRGRWWRRDVVVVVAPDGQALAGLRDVLVYTVTGDGTVPTVLRRAAVRRARTVVVVTGDDVENAAIAAEVHRVAPEACIDVEIGDRDLAEALGRTGLSAGATVTTFDAVALTAAAVLDDLGLDTLPDEPVLVFGRGPLVDALVLELFRRQRARRISVEDARPLRIVLFGPDAVERCATLTPRMSTDREVLEIEAITLNLDRTADLLSDPARHLPRYEPRHVVVAVPGYLEGGGLALTLARRLGRGVKVALITETDSNPFGTGEAREDPTRARIEPSSVAQRAYNLAVLRTNRDEERLARALFEVEPRPAGVPVGWTGLAAGEKDSWRNEAQMQIDGLRYRRVPLWRSAELSSNASAERLLRALWVDRPSALAVAGLHADFTAPDALVAAANGLSSDPVGRFEVWCELARLHVMAAPLAEDRPVAGEDDVDRLLLLRRTVLGDDKAQRKLPRDPTIDLTERVVVLVGAVEPIDEIRVLLDALFLPAAITPTVFYTGDEESVALLGPQVRAVPAAAGAGPRSSRQRLLDLWTATVSALRVSLTDVRVLLLPGATTDEILLARAMGVPIGRPQWCGEPDLGPTLLNGDTGIVVLPHDRMTVRAFLNPGRWPVALEEDHEALAADLHQRYVARQEKRKETGDSALQPWSTLSPALRESNLAMVDDIPQKLAVLRLCLDPRPAAPPDGKWPDTVQDDHLELLAEMEHGRYNAERLQRGWALAERDTAQFVSSHLVPWAELAPDVQDYDREAIDDLPEVLAARNIGLRRV
jgi:voltage-gated potassium channel Kch